jgi:glucosamine--fructose-6-phosphate aminotransferase (isomerizing)
MLDRETAMQMIYEENVPRAESFKWYCDTININAVDALKAINGAKKYYAAN